MKELRELVKKYSEILEPYKKNECELFSQKMLNAFEQAIEAQEKREAEKVALIDKEIEKLEKASKSYNNVGFGNSEALVDAGISGLEQAKSILQGEVIDE